MLQDFSSSYYMLQTEFVGGSFDRPSMYVREMDEIRSVAGVDMVVGKIGSSHFEIRSCSTLPDGVLALPESDFRKMRCRERDSVLIAKERAVDLLSHYVSEGGRDSGF